MHLAAARCRRIPWLAPLALIVFLTVAATASAQTVYDDGGTYTISGPSGAIIVSNGTTVNVVDGAEITAAIGAAVQLNFGATLNVTGGLIEVTGAGAAILAEASTVNISGGSVSAPVDVALDAADAAFANAFVTISGGSLVGASYSLRLGASFGALSVDVTGRLPPSVAARAGCGSCFVARGIT